MAYFERLGSGIVIRHPDGCFRMSTDSMLLADFITLRPGSRIADLGCGSGNISFLLADRDPGAQITGFELQDAAVRAARENVATNALDHRIAIVQADLRQLRARTAPCQFDLAISNPPYFPVGSGKVSDDPLLRAARSEETCSLADLCQAAAWLLRTGGTFALVHKPGRLVDLCTELRGAGLEPKRLRLVRHHPGADASLVLLECRRGGKPGLTLEQDLLLFDTDGSPSEDYRRAYHLLEP